MNCIDRAFSALSAHKNLLSSLEKGRSAAVTGLSPVHRAAFISATVGKTGRRAFVICPDEAEATKMVSDLQTLGKDAVLLVSREYSLSAAASSKEWEHKRLYTLSAVADGAFSVCVGSIEAFLQITTDRDTLKQNTFKISVGDTLKLSVLQENLILAGYVRVDEVEGAGQFSLRGGIVDLFPTGLSTPVRIEFWGDEVDTLCYFDPDTQRRTDNIKSVLVSPAHESLFDTGELCVKLEKLLSGKRKLTDAQKARIEQDIDAIKSERFADFDRYLPLMQESAVSALDYIDDMLFLCDMGGIKERHRALLARQAEDVALLLENGIINPLCSNFYKSKGEFLSAITEKNALYLDNFARSSYETPLDNLDSVSMAVLPAWRGGAEILREEMRGNNLILVGNEKTARLLCDDLQKEGVDAVFSENLPETVGAATVTVGTLSAGFYLPSADFTVITHSGIKAAKRKAYYKNGKGISSLDELHFGDFVVHAVHGIGVFRGVKSLENNGIVKDYLRLEYAKGDALYVPVTQLDLISKYIGAGDGANIKVNKLGGTAWQSTKARVKGAVRDMAKQLTALYSKRLEIKGHAFSEDTDIQSDFEARFPFEETDDQLRCINEIKADMERPVPMDRLLCGDVGFGKTEVALRAAFKCVSEGKQCALMAPTTILAWQHFNTVKSRFGDFPLETRLLSRFVSKTAQNKTIKELKRGSVDMVIGTHRLISKDIEFRDLGLIIIDEEHRFGVAQKERLKELYPAVDVLTLSATPIPRTLNMAMSGLRDMSSIDEAPEDRLPVQTYVLEQDGGVLLDAINRELRRGGQVYYLHNRVESIVACAARLKAQLPDANIGIAHGKMDEEELSSVWKQLLDGEIDILVCTTIIETGVDVPNANTLIIEDADRMGLSQLHQLRGRVGRSPRRAYAYFCFKRGKGLTEIAEKRLEAIREYTEFGSGFKIALRDLELRGAGSLLGGEQHGHLESVGYDMYIRLLQDAISEEKGEKVQEENNCVIDVNVSAHIPESYIPALPQRLSIYRRIADIKTEEDASDVIDELCDRFGEPPRAVLGLIDVAQIRNRAAECGITEIGQTGKNILLYTQALTEEYTTRLISHYKNRFMLNAGKRPYYSIKLENESVPVCLKEIMSVLCEQDN